MYKIRLCAFIYFSFIISIYLNTDNKGRIFTTDCKHVEYLYSGSFYGFMSNLYTWQAEAPGNSWLSISYKF